MVGVAHVSPTPRRPLEVIAKALANGDEPTREDWRDAGIAVLALQDAGLLPRRPLGRTETRRLRLVTESAE